MALDLGHVRASLHRPIFTTSILFDHLVGTVVRETRPFNASISKVLVLRLPWSPGAGMAPNLISTLNINIPLVYPPSIPYSGCKIDLVYFFAEALFERVHRASARGRKA